MRTLAIARRELLAFFHAPIAYVVIVVFLALQGFSFWAVVQVLADPARPAGYGAVLRAHFGGTLIYWAGLFAVIALLTMRLVAEERKTGTFEALMTTRVGPGEVAVGKWLGALAFYLLLWVPTALYPLILAHFAPPGTAIDPGPVLSGYLAVVLSGAGFLALGLAASAVTENQIIAVVLSFDGLLGLLLFGQLYDVGVDGALIRHLDLRARMDAAARGAIDLDAVCLWLGMAALGLALATWAIARGRGSRAAARRRAVAVALVAVNVVLAGVVSARHPVRWDWSATDVNTLDPRTLAVLDSIHQPVEVTVVRPEIEEYEPVYAEVDRLLAQMAGAQPLLARRDLDASRDAELLRALSLELALSTRDLADGGAVVFDVAGRRRGVDLIDLAGFGRDALDTGAMVRFSAEEAFARALAEVAEPDPTRVCATSAHGELPMEPRERGAHWGPVAERLRRAGMSIEDAGDVAGGVPEGCRVLVVAGPEVPLGGDAALAIARFLEGGGRVLVAASDAAPAAAATGLELVTAEHGIALAPGAVVVDPGGEIDLPMAWATADGYGAHAITAAYSGRRYTVWQHPRAVSATEPAVVIVRGSEVAWGETDLAALYAGDDVAAGGQDLVGVRGVAAAVEIAGGGRLVVLGSATSPSSELAGRGVGAADALAASAIAWLAGRGVAIEIGDKTPEHVRLIMSAGARRAVFAGCVVILPLLAAGLGALLWWRRRRG